MKNSYGEMIHRYLDGILPDHLEHQLFDELARNPDLRKSLSMEIQLQKAAGDDSTAIIPPENIRSGVFAALDIPLSADAPEIVAAAQPPLLTFTSIALVSMLFGGMMVWLGFQARETLPTAQETHVAASYSAGDAFTGGSRTNSTPQASTNQALPPRPHSSSYGHSLQLSTPESDDMSTPIKRPAPQPESPVFPAAQYRQILQSVPAAHIAHRDLYVASELRLPEFLTPYNEIPMSIAVRGSQDYAGTSGVALTALYSLDDDNAFGIEVGRAQLTRYEQRKTGGMDKQVGISESVAMIGLAHRISLPSISFGECMPYLQSFAGATTTGAPVGHATIGVQWTPDRRVTLSGGIDAMIYGYRASGSWKSGTMTSLVYGVSVVL